MGNSDASKQHINYIPTPTPSARCFMSDTVVSIANHPRLCLWAAKPRDVHKEPAECRPTAQTVDSPPGAGQAPLNLF